MHGFVCDPVLGRNVIPQCNVAMGDGLYDSSYVLRSNGTCLVSQNV